MTTIPEQAYALLDAPEVATVATVEPSGQPQLSIVWVRRDGDAIVFSTVRGRRKTANIERNPRVTILVHAAQNPYRYVEIRGHAEISDDPGGTLIDELSRIYKGEPWSTDPPGTERVIVRVTPYKVLLH